MATHEEQLERIPGRFSGRDEPGGGPRPGTARFPELVCTTGGDGMTPTPPPVPAHLATDALRHADDVGVLLFVVAILLVGVAGWR